MKVISYVVTDDYGFAPNPFHGFLTLATCKPLIRKSCNTKVGDVLLGKAARSNKLIYIGIISEILSIEEYSTDSRFELKKPRKIRFVGDIAGLGDNIYFKRGDIWEQIQPSLHKEADKCHDLSGKRVLICEQFWYFGENATDIPLEFLSFICKGRGMKHSKEEDKSTVKNFMIWLEETFPQQGILGNPSMKL